MYVSSVRMFVVIAGTPMIMMFLNYTRSAGMPLSLSPYTHFAQPYCDFRYITARKPINSVTYVR